VLSHIYRVGPATVARRWLQGRVANALSLPLDCRDFNQDDKIFDA
jgi:hypothetical protein